MVSTYFQANSKESLTEAISQIKISNFEMRGEDETRQSLRGVEHDHLSVLKNDLLFGDRLERGEGRRRSSPTFPQKEIAAVEEK